MAVPDMHEAAAVDSRRWGAQPAGPAGLEQIDVDGGVVWVDPTSPDAPPAGQLNAGGRDGELTREALVGPDTPGAMAPAASAENAQPPTAWTPAARDVARLGVLRWLRTWSPEPVDGYLLAVEETMLLARLAGLVPDGDEVALSLWHRHGDELLRYATADPADRQGLPGLRELAFRAARSWWDLVDVTDPREPDLAEAVRELGPPRADELSGPIAPLWPDWSAETVRADAVLSGVHRGAERSADPSVDARDAVTGIDSVDWWQVPSGVLAPGEDTVAWTARAVGADAARLDVRVSRDDRHRDPVSQLGEPPSLLARVHLGPAGRLPIEVPLRADRDDYVGSAVLPVPVSVLSGTTVVDVVAPGTGRASRLGPDRVRARAHRWAVRAVTRLRLAAWGRTMDDTTPAESARRAIQRGVADLRTLESTEGRSGARDLTRRQRARMQALDVACLRLLGDLDEARATEALLVHEAASVSSPVTQHDVAVPDLAAPGWRLTVAERGMLVPAP